MKTKSVMFMQIFFLLVCGKIVAQSHISGTINPSFPVRAISGHNITVPGVHGLVRCDKVLIIQMKNADIDTSNTSAYGGISAYNNTGNYEYGFVANVSGSTVMLMNPLTRSYDPVHGIVQLVQVPVYNDIVITGLLTCLPWNGTTGGVLAFEACNVTMNDDIDVSGKGFLGGTLINGSYTGAVDLNYMEPAPSLYAAEKGEGVYISHSTTRVARGCNANGGGGGTNINGGGAGGGNYGAGGTGGDIYSSLTVPPNTPFTCGGIGGLALNYGSALNTIYLGGGGGAGHENDSHGSGGANGGAIILIQAASIDGNGNNIISNGLDVPIADNDGQGGGGAGGTILLDVPANNIGNCSISAEGGNGGTDNYILTADCHGKGGGGGGGIIWTVGSLPGSVSTNVNGGLAGLFPNGPSHCYPGSFGATDGVVGGILTNLSVQHPKGCAQAACDTAKPGKKTTGIINQAARDWQVRVFPNPSNGHVTIEGLPATENVSIMITDITGKVIFNKTVTTANGTYSIELPTDQATYFIELKNKDNQVIHKKLMIAK